MAKAIGKEKAFKSEFPSLFGSHKSMINEDKTKELGDAKMVVLVDEKGTYTTFVDRLDSGAADPRRFDWPSRGISDK